MPVGDSLPQLKRDAKAALQLAFDDLGGVERLVEWANEPGNLGSFYNIWSKIIPKDVTAKVNTVQKLTVVWESTTPTEQPPIEVNRTEQIEDYSLEGEIIESAIEEDDD